MLMKSMTFLVSKVTELCMVEGEPCPHGHLGQMRRSHLRGDIVLEDSKSISRKIVRGMDSEILFVYSHDSHMIQNRKKAASFLNTINMMIDW